ADAMTLCVRTVPEARSMRLWSAYSPDRDFRDAEWSAGSRRRRTGYESFAVPRPAEGFVAGFADVTYGSGRSNYALSTNLSVIAADPAGDGPRPRASRAVCAAAQGDD